ncbi:hypothetical protein O7622_00575 [Micromonospora sp. WMMD1076]|nr:hypothetical protein [Micromonospora sp. WMMD1076]WFF07132.1 hypothetical protein O7622_00575 [Micromonospora sp. WMMD1076]
MIDRDLGLYYRGAPDLAGLGAVGRTPEELAATIGDARMLAAEVLPLPG